MPPGKATNSHKIASIDIREHALMVNTCYKNKISTIIVMIGISSSMTTLGKGPMEAQKSNSDRLTLLEKKVAILESQKLRCSEGPEVMGKTDQWSPWATCPKGSTAVGLAKLDLHGQHNKPTLHINDLRCGSQGCKTWCVGSPCTLRARCCTIKR